MVPTLTPDCGQLQLHLQKSTCSESKLCILYTLVHMFLRYKMYHTQLQQYSVHSNRLRPSSHFPSCAIEDGASVEMYPAWLEPGRPSMAPYFRRPPPGLRAMREALGVRPRPRSQRIRQPPSVAATPRAAVGAMPAARVASEGAGGGGCGYCAKRGGTGTGEGGGGDGEYGGGDGGGGGGDGGNGGGGLGGGRHGLGGDEGGGAEGGYGIEGGGGGGCTGGLGGRSGGDAGGGAAGGEGGGAEGRLELGRGGRAQPGAWPRTLVRVCTRGRRAGAGPPLRPGPPLRRAARLAGRWRRLAPFWGTWHVFAQPLHNTSNQQ